MKLMVTIPQKLFFKYVDSIEVYEEVKNKKGEIDKKRILLDAVDYLLFDYLFYIYFSNWVSTIRKDDGVYAWLPYVVIIQDNPQLRINSENTIAKRIKKLEKFGLLKTYTTGKKSSRLYFKIDPYIHEYFNMG